MANGLLDFLQGASNAAAANVSAPVDGLTWLLNKLGADIKTPVGGSDWMRERGLTAEPTNKLAGILGESVGGVLPMVTAAKAPQIAQGLLQAERNLAAPRTLNPQAGVVKVDYRGQHTAPMKDGGNAPLHDLTQTYPDDIYSSKAAQYYGHYGGGDMADRQAIALMQAAKGKPDMPVTMYRAVPYEKTAAQQVAELDKQIAAYMKRGTVPSDSYLKGSDWYENAGRMKERLMALTDNQAPEKLIINNGDWVTLSKQYAKEHGEGALNGKYKIISQKIPARKLFTDGNSIQEFGYDESGKIATDLLGAIAGGGMLGYGGYQYLNDK